MLDPLDIPTSEPIISIGVILPEDKTQVIRLKLPNSHIYSFSSEKASGQLNESHYLTIKINKKGFTLYANIDKHNIEIECHKQLIISPQHENEKTIPQSGLLVEDVVTGRGFHWKKRINLYLPGKIIVKRIDNQLMLINKIPIETYLMCVATSEMGAASPLALIEAQTIAARSWLLASAEQKHKNLGIDACNDDCCQRYQGTTYLTKQSIAGAKNTHGRVIMYDGKICDARYSKSCGGMSESYHHIWDGDPVPYLSAIPDMKKLNPLPDLSSEKSFSDWIFNPPKAFCSPAVVPENTLKQYLGSVDEKGHYFRWEKILSQKELTENIKNFKKIDIKIVLDLIALERGDSGRIKTLLIKLLNSEKKQSEILLENEYSIRQILHKSFLYSSAFIIKKVNKDNSEIPEEFKLYGAGWGHGAGLCQIGALGMALSSYTTEEILKHYYKNSILQKIY